METTNQTMVKSPTAAAVFMKGDKPNNNTNTGGEKKEKVATPKTAETSKYTSFTEAELREYITEKEAKIAKYRTAGDEKKVAKHTEKLTLARETLTKGLFRKAQ